MQFASLANFPRKWICTQNLETKCISWYSNAHRLRTFKSGDRFINPRKNFRVRGFWCLLFNQALCNGPMICCHQMYPYPSDSITFVSTLPLIQSRKDWMGTFCCVQLYYKCWIVYAWLQDSIYKLNWAILQYCLNLLVRFFFWDIKIIKKNIKLIIHFT